MVDRSKQYSSFMPKKDTGISLKFKPIEALLHFYNTAIIFVGQLQKLLSFCKYLDQYSEYRSGSRRPSNADTILVRTRIYSAP